MVMSIRVMSAGRGFEYLLKSVAAGDGDRDLGTPLTRYYTAKGTPPGTWLGSGLAGIGTDEAGRLHEGDAVTEEQLERLLGSGVDPVTGAKLGAAYPVLQPPARRIAARGAELGVLSDDATRSQQVSQIEQEERARISRTPVAGFDLTFSPPKSFSTLWGVSDVATQSLLARAHHAAMRDTLSLLERKVAATRVGRGGVASMPVRGVVAAGFDHYDTRASDPQLHTHVVVSNKVQGVDGKWRALDSWTLHKATVALSASYNAFLTDRATRLVGVSWLPVRRRSSQFTGWEISGVPAELLAEFSRRTLGVEGTEGIEHAAQRLIGEYRTAHGHSPSQAAEARLRQQATLQTRPEKKLHSLAELTAEWRARTTSVLGEDATTWARKLLSHPRTEAVLRADDLPLDLMHDIAAVVLIEVGNRRATWGHWNLYSEAARQTMGLRFASADDRERVLAGIVARAERDSIRLTPEYDRASPAPFVKDGYSGFQPRDTIAYTSQDILDAEARLLEHATQEAGPRLPVRLVHRHTSRPIRGVRLADDQAAAMLQLAASGRVLDVLVGPAGTGKTTALRALHRAWTATYGKDSVIGLAPSAAAADVLGQELGIRTENIAKYLHEYTHGRWNLKPDQLVLIDEASLAGTLALDRITSHAASVGAKVVLIGDHAQLSAVETGGAFGMLARTRDDVAELVEVRRFSADWEKTASLGLRHGDPAVLTAYEEHGRVHGGDQDAMLDAVYQAWSTDRDAGLRSVMIAATAETVTALNRRARADLIAADRVEESGLALHDDTTAGTGDMVVTRLNDRQLTTSGGSWVKNGDRWQVTRTFEDGALAVRRLGKNDALRGRAVVLPASYVGESVEFGYATTTHRAQGSTVDTAHALIDPQVASRNLLYVALTRGRVGNHAYVIDAPDENAEAHHDLAEPTTATERLVKVLGRSDADHSASETMRLAVQEHTSLATLLREYETIATYAQDTRWAALIEDAPLDEAVRDDVFASAYYPALQATLRRAESHGYGPDLVLADAARALHRYEPAEEKEPADSGLLLTRWIDKVTAEPRRDTNRPGPARVAGLLPRPVGPMSEDMGAALTERQQLIERAVQQLTIADMEAGAPWTKRLSTPGSSPRPRVELFRAAATIRFYRERHGITGPSPIGNSDQVDGLEQAYEYRAARAAYARAKYLTNHEPDHPVTRTGPNIDRRRGVSL